MKKLLCSSAVLLPVSAPALASKDLAQKTACLACHAVDKNIVGPVYLDVPAQPAPSEADAKALAACFLEGAK